MSEKLICNLPHVRVGESLNTAAMRVAARYDRSLSWGVRVALQEFVLSHGESMAEEEVEDHIFRGAHCAAGEPARHG